MHLYLAGLYTSHFGLHGNLYARAPENIKLLRNEITWYLESYHYIHKGRYVENIRKDGVKVFLDSGAFSAFSLGAEIDIGAYAEFVREHQDIIEMASVLDAIGDYEGTYRNQMELERRGVEVLPCFHYGEPFELCSYYAKNYDYITIGGMVPISNQKLEPWLDELWATVLTDKDGFAVTKVHGFGQTARHLMSKYPWYSVDSSSWVQAAANGSVLFPEVDRALPISSSSPMRKTIGQHASNMPEMARGRIEELAAYYGTDVAELGESYVARWALNAFTFDRLGKNMGEDHWLRPYLTTQPLLF